MCVASATCNPSTEISWNATKSSGITAGGSGDGVLVVIAVTILLRPLHAAAATSIVGSGKQWPRMERGAVEGAGGRQ